jgi:restriction system protein
MTTLDDAPLLHEPDLMLAVLRVAAVKAGTLDDCLDHLRALRQSAQIDEPMPEAQVRTLLEAVQVKLRRAGLIEAPAPGRFRITARGRQVLDDNPDGVDDSVLMQLPEFRAVNGRSAIAPRVPGAPAAYQRAPDTDYQRGFEAFLAGIGLADNPNPPDVRAFLDWENGWSQARDEQLRQLVRPQPERRRGGKAGAGRGSGRAGDR